MHAFTFICTVELVKRLPADLMIGDVSINKIILMKDLNGDITDVDNFFVNFLISLLLLEIRKSVIDCLHIGCSQQKK